MQQNEWARQVSWDRAEGRCRKLGGAHRSRQGHADHRANESAEVGLSRIEFHPWQKIRFLREDVLHRPTRRPDSGSERDVRRGPRPSGMNAGRRGPRVRVLARIGRDVGTRRWLQLGRDLGAPPREGHSILGNAPSTPSSTVRLHSRSRCNHRSWRGGEGHPILRPSVRSVPVDNDDLHTSSWSDEPLPIDCYVLNASRAARTTSGTRSVHQDAQSSTSFMDRHRLPR
jgi:hypothetical protein